MAIRKKPFCLRMKGFFASVQEARKIFTKKRKNENPAFKGVDRNKWYLLA